MNAKRGICPAIFLIVLFMAFLSTCHGAQRRYPKHQFGLGFSGVSGAGLSWQVELNPRWAIQANGFAYYFGKNPPEDLDIYTIFGGEVQYNLLKSSDTRFYALLGASRWFLEERSKESFRLNDKEIVIKHKKNDNISNFGAGLGFEYKVIEEMAISFELDYLFQESKKTRWGELIDRSPGGTSFNGPTFGVGIRYAF